MYDFFRSSIRGFKPLNPKPLNPESCAPLNRFNLSRQFVLPFRYLFRYVLKPRHLTERRRLLGQNTYSSAGEDLFVLAMLDRKYGGTYLEIGSQDPISASNTFLLEQEFHWRGVSLEIRADFYKFFSWRRKNPCVLTNATTVDYASLMQKYDMPERIDFLQIDIDPAEGNLRCLQRLPWSRYTFSVITFEHDQYAAGDRVMEESRAFLVQKGYVLAAKSVSRDGMAFEDWWFDPKVVSYIPGPVALDGAAYQDVLEEVIRIKGKEPI